MKYSKKEIKDAVKQCKTYIELGNLLNIDRKSAVDYCNLYNINTKHFKYQSMEFMVGAKYGKLTVLKTFIKRENRRSFCECVCDCGNVVVKRIDGVKSLRIVSCGCFNRNKISLLGCNNPAYKGFPNISGQYFSQLKRSAQVRNIIFNLTKQDLENLYLKQNKRCALTNIPIYFGSNKNISLDRIDSRLGYIENNIQFVIKDINLMKRNLDETFFIYLCNCVAKQHPMKIVKSDLKIPNNK